MEQAKYDVFISYSRKDSTIVEQICSLFKQNDISYWIDKQDIYAGGEFLSDIVQAIRECKITLFISSSHSNNSIYTAKEVAMAFNEGKYIIPYKIDTSTFNKNLELVLCDLNWVEAFPFDETKALELVANIKSLLTGERKQEINIAPVREHINIEDWDEPGNRILKYIKKIFKDK